jgi:hypothetical protein
MDANAARTLLGLSRHPNPSTYHSSGSSSSSITAAETGPLADIASVGSSLGTGAVAADGKRSITSTNTINNSSDIAPPHAHVIDISNDHSSDSGGATTSLIPSSSSPVLPSYDVGVSDNNNNNTHNTSSQLRSMTIINNNNNDTNNVNDGSVDNGPTVAICPDCNMSLKLSNGETAHDKVNY